MPAPICVKCRVQFRCQKNDAMVNDVSAGNFPSSYWMGDLFECPVCHTEIVTGFGRPMSAELWERGFSAMGSITFAHEPAQLEQFAAQFPGAR